MSGTRTPMANQTTLELIARLHSTRCLWDIKSKEYQNKDLKQQELEKLAYQFNTTPYEIARRIKSLKTQFRREHNKIKKMMNNPRSNTSKRSTWFGYDNLTFLLENDGANNSVQEESGDENGFEGIKFEFQHIEPQEQYCNASPYYDDSTESGTNDRKRVKTENNEFHSMTNGQEDSFDHFGKYVASLLRTLPQHRAHQLQADIVAMILKP
ncbi:unnamed protein product [Callosobruchus maculatus]|uniref:MADF domain-containing protein n=1 Tax=Callosobruchus maculatus TaxID=64391 RepID=A0A653BUT3_CALMS|nr:unnamed protein product [Callosobruchus maculatus]